MRRRSLNQSMIYGRGLLLRPHRRRLNPMEIQGSLPPPANAIHLTHGFFTSSLVIKVSQPEFQCITSIELIITRCLIVLWLYTIDETSTITTSTDRTCHI